MANLVGPVARSNIHRGDRTSELQSPVKVRIGAAEIALFGRKAPARQNSNSKPRILGSLSIRISRRPLPTRRIHRPTPSPVCPGVSAGSTRRISFSQRSKERTFRIAHTIELRHEPFVRTLRAEPLPG